MNRKTRLKADPAKVRAWQEKSRKPLKKTKLKAVNVEREQKRLARRRKWYASAEYKRQRAESLERAGNRCEADLTQLARYGGRWALTFEAGRCPMQHHLHMHEIRYRGAHSRPSDRIMLCRYHHALVEAMDHPTRRRYLQQGAKG